MRAAIVDEEQVVINVIVVDRYEDWPGCLPAEDTGNIGDWWSGQRFVTVWDPAHPRYAGPYDSQA
jgi:hypothetical protein